MYCYGMIWYAFEFVRERGRILSEDTEFLLIHHRRTRTSRQDVHSLGFLFVLLYRYRIGYYMSNPTRMSATTVSSM